MINESSNYPNKREVGHVEVHDISFSYPCKGRILDSISFSVRKGECIGIMGPSGCGKSTLLKLIAGILKPSAGSVKIGVNTPEIESKSGTISIAFQHASLLPWRNCLGNILVSSSLLGVQPKLNMIHELMDSLGLKDFKNLFPHQLSGGIAQRTSLARALAIEPKVLLLDEPLSSVDWPLRKSILVFLRNFCCSRGITVLFVSHDARELVYLCTRIEVINPENGTLREFNTPSISRECKGIFSSSAFFEATMALDHFAYPS